MLRLETIVVSQSDFTEFTMHDDRPIFGSGGIREVPLSVDLNRFACCHSKSLELVATSSPLSDVLIARNLDGMQILLSGARFSIAASVPSVARHINCLSD